VQNDGLYIKNIKELTEELCECAVNQNGTVLEYIPEEYQTPNNMCNSNKSKFGVDEICLE
jgi:hypothetical protein